MATSSSDDRDRLRAEYADRTKRLSSSDQYSPFNPAFLFMVQQRQRDTLALLRQQGFYPLSNKRILDVGCGYGGVLREYMGYETEPNVFYGTDLLTNRVKIAHTKLPNAALTCADGQSLPYTANSFDLVLQYTVFSSILDDEIKKNIAHEMLRIVRKPGGMILWYDFWLNPVNRNQTRGIRPAEIKRLFPNCTYQFRRITLAPPLGRRLVKISWILSAILEKLRVLNTHYLVAIRPIP